MRRMIVLTVASLLLLLAGPAHAWEGGDNTAVAVNTKDGTTLFRFAFSIHKVMNGTVDQTNAAVAVSSCTDCQTVAIAIQVVLVMGDADTVTPTNLALAYNIGCTLCETYAAAYQFVWSTSGTVHLTAEGNRKIADIRKRFKELEGAGLTIEQLQQQVEVLVNELVQVLQQELVVVEKSDTEASASPSPQPSPTSSTTTVSPSPSQSPSPSPSPEPTSPSPATSPSP